MPNESCIGPPTFSLVVLQVPVHVPHAGHDRLAGRVDRPWRRREPAIDRAGPTATIRSPRMTTVVLRHDYAALAVEQIAVLDDDSTGRRLEHT